MRKIAAIFIVLALIMTVAVACGNNGDEIATQPIETQYSPVSQTTVPTSAEAEDSAPSYVLTTQADRTVPWVSTTRFEITQATQPTSALSDIYGTTASVSGIYGTTASGTTDYNIYVNMEEISRPQVNTSNAPTFVTTTAASTTSADPTTATATATTKADSAPSEDSKPVQLLVNSIAYGNGVIYVEVDPSNWNSGFVSKSDEISVKVNGESAGTVSCKIPSNKTGDNYEIKINLTSIDVPEGSTVEFTIPAGIVKNKAGNQHNLSYSTSVIVE